MDKTNSLPTMKRAGDKKIILGLMSLSWNYYRRGFLDIYMFE